VAACEHCGKTVNALLAASMNVVLCRKCFKEGHAKTVMEAREEAGLPPIRQPIDEIFGEMRFLMTKLGLGCIFASGLCGLVLLTRVKTILGTRFFMISGSNMFDARGFQMGEGLYFLLWAAVLAGICYGVWLILRDPDRLPGPREE
jgi:hypothetical protein